MRFRLVGIDCATRDAKIGLAFGTFENNCLSVTSATSCAKNRSAANTISSWLLEGVEPALLAIDAPLGWPQSLSLVLAKHRAGEELTVAAHDMFRRATDRFIKQKTGKTPLDVGADRIARTAHAALSLLKNVRDKLDLEQIPLAWDWPPRTKISAIEVYPAATLVTHGFQSSRYKTREQATSRKDMITSLSSYADFGGEVYDRMIRSADVLDAVVCLLAARDFLVGEAMPPVDLRLAEIEGWIWTRAPTGT